MKYITFELDNTLFQVHTKFTLLFTEKKYEIKIDTPLTRLEESQV